MTSSSLSTGRDWRAANSSARTCAVSAQSGLLPTLLACASPRRSRDALAPVATWLVVRWPPAPAMDPRAGLAGIGASRGNGRRRSRVACAGRRLAYRRVPGACASPSPWRRRESPEPAIGLSPPAPGNTSAPRHERRAKGPGNREPAAVRRLPMRADRDHVPAHTAGPHTDAVTVSLDQATISCVVGVLAEASMSIPSSSIATRKPRKPS